MNDLRNYNHWKLEADKDQILWIYFDKKNSSVNTLDKEVMDEFSAILDFVNTQKNYSGLIIASAKHSGFIAGADISQFNQFDDIHHAISILKLGQGVIDQLEKIAIPTVAMIEGFCLGGGLELALGCRYLVAEESNKTRLGLPEVKLGIHPGWGGTVRLPRRIGAMQGLNLILSGSTVSGKTAAKLGIVDAAVPKRQLVNAARYFILKQPEVKKLSFLQSVQDNRIARQVLAHFIRKKLASKANPTHYPAPFQALDNWEMLGVESEKAYEQEAKTCGKLFFSDTSNNLVRVFYLQERLKNLVTDKSFKVNHVHVIGAGTMGGDIAAWCAFRGIKVTLQDLEPQMIAPAIKRAYKLYKEKLRDSHLVQKAMDCLIPDISGDGIATADVIIEAIVEKLEVKQHLFKKIESMAKPEAILATNTSSIPLDEINTVLDQPERLVGIHFFNPVPKMLLVEIVKGEQTSEQVFDQSIQFVRQIDRLPLPVKSSPGFLINRILMPYLLESVKLLEEGVPITAIDKAMIDFGMPMGPITLADTVGLDICLSVANNLTKYFDTTVPKQLIEKVEQGKLGKKTGEGFYQYDKQGKMIKPDTVKYEKPLEQIANRLVLVMINEAFSCLREGVIDNSDLLDAGMIFGTGFAPFRGGPMHYAKTQGIRDLYQQFLRQQEQSGDNKRIAKWEENLVM